jgi:hypothetical protein
MTEDTKIHFIENGHKNFKIVGDTKHHMYL